eukprot:CAMPEP_0204585774 /NCGR_PEP_ID=MMETSP0661-20131031/47114_1 /ASSEMBLY_ACC=CAM_ASM_000606 /TAXON_ID=109239 /ORGANISM="Alexandrium margalefi, Strain AMGDE01CS-322" /LENGTH=174 /DNA_ID=CAMNT_0051595359 /DNA_START=232 /DNA_END=756 /DNA_ORIENTATION=-
MSDQRLVMKEGQRAVLRPYCPNQYKKSFCGVAECRGEEGLLYGRRHGAGKPWQCSCWRYSFRWHLAEAHRRGGFMLTVVEGSGLGEGQVIEAEMARAVGIRVVTIDFRGMSLMPPLFLTVGNSIQWRKSRKQDTTWKWKVRHFNSQHVFASNWEFANDVVDEVLKASATDLYFG